MSNKRFALISFIIIVAAYFLFIGIEPKEDTRTHMNEEFIKNDVTFKISVAYENEYPREFTLDTERKYNCEIDYEIAADEEVISTRSLRITSPLNPIKIEEIILKEKYQDENIIIYACQLEYYGNGNVFDELLLFHIESYVYLKEEKEYFIFENWNNEVSQKMKSYGYEEYDEKKVDEIREICYQNSREANKEILK